MAEPPVSPRSHQGPGNAPPCTLYTVQCTLYSVQCTLYSVHYKLYTVTFTLYTVQSTEYSVQCALYTLPCTLYTVHCILYTVYCTLYTVRCVCSEDHCSSYASDWPPLLQDRLRQISGNVHCECRVISLEPSVSQTKPCLHRVKFSANNTFFLGNTDLAEKA